MRRAVLGLVFVVGCGADSATDPVDAAVGSPDAGTAVDSGPTSTDAGADPGLLVGTGQDRFEPLAEGAGLDLVAGPQGGGRFGGHHVLVAVRLVSLRPSDLSTLEVRLLDEDGAERAFVARDPARSPFIADQDLPNLTPRLDDCCEVAGAPLTIEATAMGVDGTVYTGTLTGTASACPNPSQGPSLCP